MKRTDFITNHSSKSKIETVCLSNLNAFLFVWIFYKSTDQSRWVYFNLLVSRQLALFPLLRIHLSAHLLKLNFLKLFFSGLFFEVDVLRFIVVRSHSQQLHTSHLACFYGLRRSAVKSENKKFETTLWNPKLGSKRYFGSEKIRSGVWPSWQP